MWMMRAIYDLTVMILLQIKWPDSCFLVFKFQLLWNLCMRVGIWNWQGWSEKEWDKRKSKVVGESWTFYGLKFEIARRWLCVRLPHNETNWARSLRVCSRLQALGQKRYVGAPLILAHRAARTKQQQQTQRICARISLPRDCSSFSACSFLLVFVSLTLNLPLTRLRTQTQT